MEWKINLKAKPISKHKTNEMEKWFIVQPTACVVDKMSVEKIRTNKTFYLRIKLSTKQLFVKLIHLDGFELMNVGCECRLPRT